MPHNTNKHKNNENMLIEQRKIQAKYLRHGDIKLLAQKAKITIGSVSNWINGVNKESICEVYFTELVKKRKQEMETAINEI